MKAMSSAAVILKCFLRCHPKLAAKKEIYPGFAPKHGISYPRFENYNLKSDLTVLWGLLEAMFG